ncbi:MAG: Crp/Fnr family transcriptional regulator [Paracoccaceae bacterium]
MYVEPDRFCAKLSCGELVSLSGKSAVETLRRGDCLLGGVLRVWPVLAVISGVLSLQSILHDGRKTISTFFMPGDIIDLRESPHAIRGGLVALSRAEVCKLSPKVFEAIMAKNVAAQQLVMSNLRGQNFRAHEHAADLAKKQALEKLASFIFECRNRDTVGVQRNRVRIPVRRVDLADYLGMQPETVSRCFRELEEGGTIRRTDLNSFQIVDAPALRRIADGDRRTASELRPPEPDLKVYRFG